MAKTSGSGLPMHSTQPDRNWLLETLREDLLAQSDLHEWTADLTAQRALDERIQLTAEALEPGAPHVAIAGARRDLAYVHDVLLAEQQYLGPLRQGARELRSLEAAGVALSQPAIQAKAQEVARLLQQAPRHILRRLTAPQMQGVLLGAAVAKRAVKAAAKSLAP